MMAYGRAWPCWLQVTWHPFQLNPQAPQDDPGRNKLQVD